MDKYDLAHKKFMQKINMLGAEFETEKLPSGPYKLIKFSTGSDIIQLLSFISQVDPEAFSDCAKLKKLVLPDSLTSIRLWLRHSLEEINIPKKVVVINNFCRGGATKFKITLEGCNKSVQNFSFNLIKNLNIINSQLIRRIWRGGFSSCNIEELRLIQANIERGGLKKCVINNLYMSEDTDVESASFIDCQINTLYMFVDSQAKADKFLTTAYTTPDRLHWFSKCTIKKIVTIVEPNIHKYVREMRDN